MLKIRNFITIEEAAKAIEQAGILSFTTARHYIYKNRLPISRHRCGYSLPHYIAEPELKRWIKQQQTK